MNLEVSTPISAEAEVKAYTLVGDDIYVKRYTNENIPTWYRQLISDIIASDNTITDLDAAVDYLSTLPAGYDQKITELRLADTTINTSLTSLVATTGSHTAAIANLNTTKVDATSAAAIARDTVGAYFADGTAGAWFNNQISTYASDIAANAMDISTLSATVDGQTVMIEDISEVSIDPITGYKLGASKIGTAPDGSITGWQFADGTGIQSSFKVMATNFSVSDGTTGYTPFSIVGTDVVFNGKVSFNSVTDAPPMVAENTNINVTTNLVPNDGWYASGHADYLFVGTPTYYKMIGANTFQEDTLLLNIGDEVYTPYISDFTKSYKISYAFKGALIGALFQIDGATASNTNVVLSGTYDPAKWYIVQALVLPNGSTAGTLFGKVQDAVTLNTVVTITDKVLSAATDWFCLGFIATADTYISRVAIEVVNTDTVNAIPVTSSNLTTALAATSTVIDGGRITTGYISADRIEANSITADKIQSVHINGYTIEGINIKGASIEGSVIKSSWIDYTSTGDLTNWQYYTLATIPGAYVANFAHDNTTGALIVDSLGYVRLQGFYSLYSNVITCTAHAAGLTTFAIDDFVRSYDSYTISTGKRVVSATPKVYISELTTIIRCQFNIKYVELYFNETRLKLEWSGVYVYFGSWSGTITFTLNTTVYTYSRSSNDTSPFVQNFTLFGISFQFIIDGANAYIKMPAQQNYLSSFTGSSRSSVFSNGSIYLNGAISDLPAPITIPSILYSI